MEFNLENGYMSFDSGSYQWRTHIQAILIRDNSQIAFLSANCRAERVYDSATKNQEIIGKRFAEISLIKSWAGDFVIRSGAAVSHPFHKKMTALMHKSLYRGTITTRSEKIEITKISFADMLLRLRNGLIDSPYYMSVTYTLQSHTYEIICRCPYINFSNATETSGAFIQPISGYVLVEDLNTFYIAYIVLYINESGVQSAEIVKRIPVDILSLKQAVGGRFFRFFLSIFTPLKFLFMTDEFAETKNIHADVKFFQYNA